MKLRAVLFDLDGTLLDTLEDLAQSMNNLLSGNNFPVHPVLSYRYFVGNGMEMLVRRALPQKEVNDRNVMRFVVAMREDYGRRWTEHTKPYTGIPELLSSLEQKGIRKAIFSNKPDEFTQVMVYKLLAEWNFSVVQGISPLVPAKPNPSVPLWIAAKLEIQPQEFLYLGDTNTDMQTATAAGMYAVGALWGFRTAGELLASGARKLVTSPQEILEFF
jgi:phosphoglycolate phosphatase